MTELNIDRESEALRNKLRLLEMENESLRVQLEIQTLDKQLERLNESEPFLNSTEFFNTLDRYGASKVSHSTPKPATVMHDRKIFEAKHMKENDSSFVDQGTQTPILGLKAMGAQSNSQSQILYNENDNGPRDRFVTKRTGSQDTFDKTCTSIENQLKSEDGSLPKDVKTQLHAENKSNIQGQRNIDRVSESKIYMKPATFDGSGSWVDYKAHFEACSDINNWTEEQKGLYLAVSLRGQAQGVFGNLGGSKRTYNELVTALEERFAPPNQTELYRAQLRERRQRATESLSEMGQDIRRLTNLAYPSAPGEVKETLAKEQFIDSLHNSDMRLRIKQARPLSLNDAVRHAVELEAFNKAERKMMEDQRYMRAVGMDDNSNGNLRNDIERLQKSMSEIIKNFEV